MHQPYRLPTEYVERVREDVATWPPLTADQLSTVLRAFGAPTDPEDGRTVRAAAVLGLARGGEAA